MNGAGYAVAAGLPARPKLEYHLPHRGLRVAAAGAAERRDGREAMDSSREARATTGADAGGPPDGELARRTQAGDREAFGRLARRYLRPVHAVAASFLRERADVEDAAQETFLRALENIRRFNPARPFAPWLYQIARNVARNRLRRRRRHPTDAVSPLEGSLADPGASLASRVEHTELRARLDAAIAALPEQRRVAFRLSEVEGYASDEVARIMGLSPGAVRAHVHHARRDLRARLAPLMKDGDADDRER